MWGTLFTTFSGTGLLEFVSLMGVVGTFARTCGCGFFMRIFWCGFWVRIFSRILGCGFFRRFCDGGFWGADFFCCFPAEKALKKSHQKFPPKNPHQRSSPRSVSSQYTTTLLLAKHTRSPQSVWVQMHLVENRFLCADGICRGSQHVSCPDVKNDAAPKWASDSPRVFFLMGRAICALTGRAARHETPKDIFSSNTFLKESSLGVFVTKNLVVSNLVVVIFTLKRSFAPFCAHLRSFALICAHLRVSASDRV